MLSNFEQTLEYYRQLARRPGGFPAVLLAPREKEIAEAPTGLGLPKTYLDFARKHIVEDVSLGALDLMPFVGGDIFEALSLANGDYRNLLIGESFVHVANYEGDLILLIKGHEMHEDSRVYYLDISSGHLREPVCLASSFEDFLVVAANLDQRSLDEQAAGSQPFLDIVDFVAPSIGPRGRECWRQIYEMYA
jgi:hypothetical protein